MEASSRGHRTLLLDGADFGQGTSSRSTKLIHGGLRYLWQGRIGVVRESLRERETLLRNAPNFVHPLGFVIPCFRWWEKSYYHLGLKMYDGLAGSLRLGRSGGLSKAQTLERLPCIAAANVTGGVHYEDGQFDDAQLLISLLRTLLAEGGRALNHCRVVKLIKKSGRVCGVVAHSTQCLAKSGAILVSNKSAFGDTANVEASASARAPAVKFFATSAADKARL